MSLKQCISCDHRKGIMCKYNADSGFILTFVYCAGYTNTKALDKAIYKLAKPNKNEGKKR